ncbi:hypothetical protein R1sor_007980 [Riccia sorocarpa]|uniref:Uncharacterized protein n=1 Tax=Riccia sorocarpa TaxID=122646 RepID=A0ABD3HUC9_9MARC
MGKFGAILLLIMVFMAVTSPGSAELVAVFTLVTYDIYRTYINPKATGKQILKVSRLIVLISGLLMGVLAVLLNLVGVSLGWVYLAMGVFICSAVIPVAFLLLWSGATATGAIAGCIIGCLAGVTTWLSVTQNARVNLDTGRNAPMLAGNLISILTGGAVCAAISFFNPQNYTWDTTRHLTMVDLDHSKVPEEDLPAKVFSKGYLTFWAIIAIVGGTVGSLVIIVLPLYESYETILEILNGMFTDDIMLGKISELDTKLDAIIKTNPERTYLLQKKQEKAKHEHLELTETTTDVDL